MMHLQALPSQRVSCRATLRSRSATKAPRCSSSLTCAAARPSTTASAAEGTSDLHPVLAPSATLRPHTADLDQQQQRHESSASRRALLSVLGAAALSLGLPTAATAEDEADSTAAEAVAEGIPVAEEAPAAEAAAEAETVAEAVAEAAPEAVLVTEAEAPSTSTISQATTAKGSGQKAFFEVAIEGAPVGRIVVELFDDVKVGSARFSDLSKGKLGVGYRLSRIDGIYDTHLRVEGVKRLSYSATGDSTIAGGDSVADLEAEMDAATRVHDQAGLVSLMVREATERPIQEKLIAKGGKLVTIQLQAGEAPNGTGFMITRGPAPALDVTNLVVGRVVEGMDIVERVAALPFSKPRTEWYDGPFFQAGKAMGDKRAVVAEKGFNRPFKRVIITSAGLL